MAPPDTPYGLIAVVVCSLALAASASDERFWVERAGGEIVTGERLSDLAHATRGPRLDWLRRISTKRRPQRLYTPNFVELMDGRQFVARSLRWEAGSIRALTDDGIITAKFDCIAELHHAPLAAWTPPLPAAALFALDGPPVLRLLGDESGGAWANAGFLTHAQ